MYNNDKLSKYLVCRKYKTRYLTYWSFLSTRLNDVKESVGWPRELVLIMQSLYWCQEVMDVAKQPWICLKWRLK